ncbi:serine integrase [Arthrobacter phage CallinAllBarbz]|uniref:Serine integrase n=1 Tax=Arthrobacter phage CallinAllBarbz TaxID=3077790 RepID=A0AA96HJD2_9CAUD|nr:serine integrase [Arthrobacter phage CallinAllBarbz]
MNVIGYARLSSAREESTSIARQREIIEEYAAARKWTLVDVVAETGASATKLRLNRPGLSKVREAVASGRAEAVLVWRLDRIARSVVDFGTLLDEGLQVVSCTEPIDATSSMGRAMAEILQVFAAMEARATSARVAMSVDYLRRNARWPGGRVPYGYRPAPHPSGTGRALELDPVAAPAVREAVDRVLAGESLYKVAEDFTARGIRTGAGASGWSVQALLGILTGDAILGRVTTRGELVRDEHGIPSQIWPPIVTLDESARLRATLAPRRAVGPRLKASRLLSGLIFCSSCGRSMVVQRRRTPRTRDGKTFYEATAYRCRAKGSGIVCEAPVSIDADKCEAEVVSSFLGAVGRLPVVEEVVSAPDPVELAEVEEAIQDTARAMADPDAMIPDLVDRLTALRARREELASAPRETISAMIETGATFAEEWTARESLEARRSLLSAAIDHVSIAPSGAGVRYDPSRIAIMWKS